MLVADNENEWKKAHYGVVKHAAVQICTWTKRAIRDGVFCYKHKFYGIETHRCAQISPVYAWCDQNCVFCWRPAEWMSLEQLHNAQFMKPEEMVEALVEKRRQLLSGFKGNERVNERLFREAYELFPSHWAISLSGEPTLYPHLPELIAYLKAHKEVKSIFLVTNGQHPEMLQTLMEQDALPTQLYLSTVAYSRTLHQALTRPRYEDGWQRFLNSVELLNTLGNKTRTVMRLTLMKGVNDDVQAFVPLIKTAQPWFVEVKSFIAIGRARQRLGVDKMLSFDEIKERAQRLSLLTSFRYEDDHPPSLIALLSRVSAQQRYIIT